MSIGYANVNEFRGIQDWTYSGSCLREMPHLGKSSRESSVNGAQIIAISIHVFGGDGNFSKEKIKTAKEESLKILQLLTCIYCLSKI